MTLQIALARELAGSVEAVWPLLTDPARMNEWSEAPVRALAPGDGGRMDGVGALRRVLAPGPTGEVRLLEVIEASEPPHRLVYRVVNGPSMVKEHRGEQTLERLPAGGTRLRWEVRIELHVGAAEALVRSSLVPSLERSLDVLARLARDAAPEPVRGARELSAVDTTPLLREARAILEAQGQLAIELREANDPKWAFARVYELVTEAQLEHLAAGRVRHPEWVLHLVPRFHHYYTTNLEAWRGGRRLDVELPWAQSFAAAESADGGARALALGLGLGVRAHIEEDLPRALADVWITHFRERCDYARFRADYLSMGDIFEVAGERLLRELPAGVLPGWMRAMRAILPKPARDALTNANAYDVPRARRMAFERGARLAAWKLAP